MTDPLVPVVSVPTAPKRMLGRGLKVSPLGLGTGPLGRDQLSEAEAGRLLNDALDLGIDFIDTARSYGLAEARIGLHISHRRNEFSLSTKGGYGVEGVQDWTGPAVTLGIHRALRVLRTDHIDVFHLHSCPEQIFEQEEILAALEEAVRDGKIVQIAYSGDNAALQAAVGLGKFSVIQTSVNLVDQASLAAAIPRAAALGMGVIAKRPLGSGAWSGTARPDAPDAGTYWDRLQCYPRWSWDFAPDELALRFAAWAPGVTCAIVGTASRDHLRRNLDLVSRGPLPKEVVSEVQEAFRQQGGWAGVT